MDVTKASMLINGIIFHGSYMLYQDPVAHNLNVFAIDITANWVCVWQNKLIELIDPEAILQKQKCRVNNTKNHV